MPAKNGVVQLPPDSVRSRILWSIPAAAILVMWVVGILGAAVTDFPTRYTLSELLRAIVRDPGRALRSGALDATFLRPYGFWAEGGPWLALVLWPLCLVPWRRRVGRVAALLSVLLAPAGFLVLTEPMVALVGPYIGVMAGREMMLGATGETYGDGLIAGGAAGLWWWLIVPLVVMTALRRVPKRENECAHCGYSTVGLREGVCPECGKAV